jgi:hypothetical protein
MVHNDSHPKHNLGNPRHGLGLAILEWKYLVPIVDDSVPWFMIESINFDLVESCFWHSCAFDSMYSSPGDTATINGFNSGNLRVEAG